MIIPDVAIIGPLLIVLWLAAVAFVLFKCQKLIAPVMLSIMASGLAALFYFLFLEPPYLVYRNVPFPATAQQVRAGEVVPLRVSICNNASKPHQYSVARSLHEVNTNALIYMSDVLVSGVPGCREAISLAHTVPQETPPGKYRIIGQTRIEGTLRTFKVDWLSQPFEVVP